MLSRPAAAALSCRQCQSTIFRAVLSRPATSSFRSLPQRQTRSLPILSRRLFSQERSIDAVLEKDTPTIDAAPKTTQAALEKEAATVASPEEALEAEESDGSDDVPWFLEMEPPRHPPSQHAVVLPTIPENGPPVLESMIKYIYEDMGLDDISLLDLRDLDPPAALGPNLIMLFGTTRSERHLHVASGRFVRWLKRNHKIEARADGLIGPGELRTKLRRLRKKAKLMGTNTAIVPGGDNGISTGWVCVNFGSDDVDSNESASFDQSGRFSGFGSARTGTTVVVQCMTETRREELDLESLWQVILKKSLRDATKVRGEKAVEQQELDALLASRVQIPEGSPSTRARKNPNVVEMTPAALQWQNLSQQRRFSTAARRLSPDAEQQAPSPPGHAESAIEPGATGPPDLMQVAKHVRDIQLVGTPITQSILENLIKAVFQSQSSIEDTAAQRLALVDQLLLTADERGMDTDYTEMYVTLVEAMVLSPAYGPAFQRSQKNFESIMAHKGCRLDPGHVLRLMTVHAFRQDWARFWDIFRMPLRFKEPRWASHYELAYRVMANTGNQKMCIEALRWVYPEMLSQVPPVMPVGSVHKALIECIQVADPEAAGLLYDPPSAEQLRVIKQRRLANREFLKMLRQVETIRAEVLAHGARQDASGLLDQTLKRMSM
ncbi:hypothetical protein G7046_g759 [Stylonectria norvegica]|nr:hypothetical protein G7046_g759 [Stylonectria norvegica]